MRALFLPKGTNTVAVVDPEALAAEFLQASEVADQPTQYQWKRAAFGSTAVLDRGGHVRLMQTRWYGFQTTTNAVAPLIPNDAGASATLWKVPYNRGYAVVGSTPATLTWTSEYPEVLEVYASWQFLRRGIPNGGAATNQVEWDAFFAVATGRDPRVQIGIRFDGAVYTGSGPMGDAEDGLARGTGLSVQTEASGVKIVIFSPPGSHQIDLVAGQTSARAGNEGSGAVVEKDGYETTGIIEGVVIGSYHLFVLAWPKGGRLTR